MIGDSQHSDGENNNEGLKKSSDDDNIILDGNYDENDDDSDDLSFFIRREHSLRRQALQHKLAAAVFAHPYPLRQYCLDAYATATKLSMARQKQQQQEQQQLMATLEGKEPPPETSRDDVVTIMSPSTELHGPIDDSSPELGEHQQLREQLHRHRYQHHHHHHHHQGEKRLRKQHQSRAKILRVIISKLLNTAPLSILLDIAESFCDLSLETIFATGKMGLFTIDKCIDILSNTVLNILDLLTSFNPFHIFEHVINLQRSAVGKTGDVVVSGIMSVATGVGSVSNAALNRLSRQGLALAGGVVIAGAGSRSGRSGSHDYGRSRKDAGAGGNPLDSKLFRRLHKMDSVSTLLAYSERSGEEAFGKHAKKRAQRMMHYNVSFQPFTATIHPKSPAKSNKMIHNVSFDLSSFRSADVTERSVDDASLSEESLNSSGSIFMRTPTSFPPTPTSRLYYFERGSRFTENVIFLARDQLRVERGLGNQNEQTRAMSSALREGSRLAVFDAADTGGGGIALSCGQHIATKVGNALYCSTRSMIPVMRNSYVYFEISVSPPPSTDASGNKVNPQVAVATLSIGLSTLEMPLNTLVGAWKGSVGLCSTGQILQAGQWLSSNSQEHSTYGCNSTVGCLVYIDDNSAFDSWEGKNVVTDVTFNINGCVIPLAATANEDVESETGTEQISDSTLSLVAPKAQELFPTVTLHSPATCVMCRFSADDLLATSRKEIGAPNGVTVYAVDGSVILDENADKVEEEVDDFLDTTSATLDMTSPHEEVAL
jgi:hypothetical protein